MDYTSYFSAPQQPYFGNLPPTPSYDIGFEKLPQDFDPSFLPYDAFSFPTSLSTTGSSGAHLSAQLHQQHQMGTIDSGINMDNMEMDNMRLPQSAHELSSYHRATPQPPSPTRTRSSSEENDAGTPTPSNPNPGASTGGSGSQDINAVRDTPLPVTAAQYRRKAQNRAAQRAFRERKEKHVRELEAKLATAQTSALGLRSDNERLKLLLQRAKTENEILRGVAPAEGEDYDDDEDTMLIEQEIDEDIYGTIGATGTLSRHRPLTARAVSPSTGQVVITRLLGAGPTWDLIQGHPLVASGAVDIAEVCEELRTKAKCNGSGPVFEERTIFRVIEEARRGGGDELI